MSAILPRRGLFLRLPGRASWSDGAARLVWWGRLSCAGVPFRLASRRRTFRISFSLWRPLGDRNRGSRLFRGCGVWDALPRLSLEAKVFAEIRDPTGENCGPGLQTRASRRQMLRLLGGGLRNQARQAMPQKIRIIGVPMDLGQSRRGVDMGPSALRVAGLQSRLKQ